MWLLLVSCCSLAASDPLFLYPTNACFIHKYKSKDNEKKKWRQWDFASTGRPTRHHSLRILNANVYFGRLIGGSQSSLQQGVEVGRKWVSNWQWRHCFKYQEYPVSAPNSTCCKCIHPASRCIMTLGTGLPLPRYKSWTALPHSWLQPFWRSEPADESYFCDTHAEEMKLKIGLVWCRKGNAYVFFHSAYFHELLFQTLFIWKC